MRWATPAFLGFLAMVLSCAPRAQQTQPIVIEPVVQEEDTTAPKAEIEVVEEAPPAAEPQEAEPITEAPAMPPAAEEELQPAPPAPPISAVYGFRIQVFAGSYINALKVKETLEKTLTQPVYVEYLPPYYKVRIGDFLTRDQAKVLLPKIKALGYTDAFIVESEIQAR